MRKLKFLVSLMTDENDYQLEQAHSAEQTAGKLGVDVRDIFTRITTRLPRALRLLKAVQTEPKDRPDAIVFEPVGETALPQVARAAVKLASRGLFSTAERSYIAELRQSARFRFWGQLATK